VAFKGSPPGWGSQARFNSSEKDWGSAPYHPHNNFPQPTENNHALPPSFCSTDLARRDLLRREELQVSSSPTRVIIQLSADDATNLVCMVVLSNLMLRNESMSRVLPLLPHTIRSHIAVTMDYMTKDADIFSYEDFEREVSHTLKGMNNLCRSIIEQLAEETYK
jgi:hypothetical protein